MKKLLFLSLSLLASTPSSQGVLPEEKTIPQEQEIPIPYDDEDLCCCYDPEMDDIQYGNSEDIMDGIQEIACYVVNKLTILENKQLELEKKLSQLQDNHE